MAKFELAGVENALGTHEARQLWSLAAEVEAHINWNSVIVEEHGVEIRHVAAVFEAEDSAHRRRGAGNFVPPQRRHHAADKVNHQVAGYAGAVCPPAAPAREVQLIERNLGRVVQPCVPIKSLRRKIGGWRIFPRARRIIAPQSEFDHLDVADRTLLIQIARRRHEHGTHAL